MKTTESDRLWRRAVQLIPAGTQTLSKGPSQWVQGFAPKYIERGLGSHVWDVDGNEFIDYPMGLGPVTLGHAHPEVTAAVVEQITRGNCFSLMHRLEVEVAETISKMVPCAEMVRFGRNGSDATTACVRAARAKTGRKYVARCGYHGWQDWSIDATYGIRAKGVLPEVMAFTVPFKFNDLDSLRSTLAQHLYAAVILEPVGASVPAAGYLAAVKELTHAYGSVLIFDEVISGFRYARGGAQEYFGVVPDLCAMGKGVANGYPLSVVCGKREYMRVFEDVFFSMTFGGEVSALAAAKATLEIMERDNYWRHAWTQGATLQAGIRSLAAKRGVAAFCDGLPSWTVVSVADAPTKTLLQQELLRRGILFSGSQFISLAHSAADIDATLRAYDEAFRIVADARAQDNVLARLEGDIVGPIFRRAV